MAAQGRNKTKYPGVYYTEGKSTTGKPVRRYYVVFKRDGKVYEEAAKVLIDDGPETRPAETPQEASAWRSRRIAAVTNTKDDARPLLTVAQLWEKWLEGRKHTRGLDSTISRYKIHLGRFFGKRVAEEICNFDVTRFRRDLEQRNLSPATVKINMALLAQLLRWGGEQELIKDPGLRFEFPKFDNQRTECMTPEQLTRYWQALEEWDDQHIADYFRIMLLTGIRRRALAAVRWEDLDLAKGFLTLRAQTAKSGKAKSVPLPAAAIRIFEAMPRNDDGYVWPSSRGGFRDVGLWGARIRKAAGLPEDFRPCHGLRHTFASMLASSGKVDLFTLQQMLTHATPAMTQRYAHLADDTLRRAASVADDVMTPGPALKVVAGKE
ncbi:site-specific integrase [Desulfomicrobium sp. ZS1]|uniref:tyrosine-type recombinase/integrase n=1 Tax=Desulfomicrobium sp. ZS1 TaxID=2952228 RepID=UPI0020B3D7ED|nr:site-specific integrase [Desulfomicrobium sp. ZS1]UTF50909.1 site-specific integrase [Desulfomicrobium sp. ZS1]